MEIVSWILYTIATILGSINLYLAWEFEESGNIALWIFVLGTLTWLKFL